MLLRKDRRSFRLLTSCFIFALVAASVFAADATARAQSLPLGGRTASMGRAGTASGRDAAMPYINPAGYALVPHDTISLSANLYRQEQITVSDYFFGGKLDPALGSLLGTPSDSGNKLQSDRFTGFPGAASVIWHFGAPADSEAIHHVLSVSIVVPQNRKRSFEGMFALRFGDGTTNMRVNYYDTNECTDYVFGPTYSLSLGRLRLGVSGFLAYSDYTRTIDSSFNSSLTNNYINSYMSSFMEGTSFGLQPVMGMQWEIIKGLSVGTSFAIPTVNLFGHVIMQGKNDSSGPERTTGANRIEVTRSEGDFEINRPARIRVGLSYEEKRQWAVAFDTSLQLARNDLTVYGTSDGTSSQEQGLPVEQSRSKTKTSFGSENAAGFYLGGEYFINNLMALRLGAFYEQSDTKIDTVLTDVLSFDVDRFGATLGFGVESDLGETTLGLEITLTNGSTIVGDPFAATDGSQFRRTDVSGYSAVFFLSGAVDLEDFGAVTQAIRHPNMLLGEAEQTLRLHDINPSLLEFEGDPELDILSIKSISYPASGIEEFDSVFKRIALIRASVSTARALLKELETQLRKFRATVAAGNLNEQDVTDMLIKFAQSGSIHDIPDQLKQLPQAQKTARVVRVAFVIRETLKRLGLDVAKLPGDVQHMIKIAEKKFAGPNIILLPAVARSLGSAEKEVALMVGEVPSVLEALGGVLDAIANTSTSPAEKPTASDAESKANQESFAHIPNTSKQSPPAKDSERSGYQYDKNRRY
jgi:hypothetical protein